MKYLKKIEPTCDFSFIITTRNNFDELDKSIKSIEEEAEGLCEIVVVDGSDINYGRNNVLNLIHNSAIKLTYTLDNKTGVFDAMNIGVENSHGRWIIMITGGDFLNKGSKALLKSIKNSENDVVVFSQHAIDMSGKMNYTFYPGKNTVWPHQSVILKRSVHERVGLYPEEYRFSSDQHLFASIRKQTSFEIRKEIFSVFVLGGITSGASLRRSHEFYSLRRKLGNSMIIAFFKAYISPFARFYLEKNPILKRISGKLKTMLFSYYEPIK